MSKRIILHLCRIFTSYPTKFCRLAGFSCRGIAAGLNFTFVSYIYFSPQKICRQAGFSCRGIAAGLKFTFVSYITSQHKKFLQAGRILVSGDSSVVEFYIRFIYYFSPQKFCRLAGFSCRGIAAGWWLSGRRRMTVSPPCTGIPNYPTNDDIRPSHYISRPSNGERGSSPFPLPR